MDFKTWLEERQKGACLATTTKDKYVYIYRAVLATTTTFKPMDYVTLSRKWADDHCKHIVATDEAPAHVLKAFVPTKNVFDAYNPGEYFYDGPEIPGKPVIIWTPETLENESRTYRDQLKLVYHWDTESDFYKVLQKQGRVFPSKRAKKNGRQYDREALSRVYALWVSPNKDWNDHWAAWAVRANDYKGKVSFYLHTIGMPRELYERYKNKERSGWDENNQAIPEFVITQADWPQLVPISVKEYTRKEILNKHDAHSQRRVTHAEVPLIPNLSKNSREYLRIQQQEKDYDPEGLWKRIKPRPKAWEKELF